MMPLHAFLYDDVCSAPIAAAQSSGAARQKRTLHASTSLTATCRTLITDCLTRSVTPKMSTVCADGRRNLRTYSAGIPAWRRPSISFGLAANAGYLCTSVMLCQLRGVARCCCKSARAVSSSALALVATISASPGSSATRRVAWFESTSQPSRCWQSSSF
jgi:hypothetical protein